MNKHWREVALGVIASPVTRLISVAPGESYRTIGVRWWGEGAYERETIDGSQTAAKKLSLVRQGDLIINKIWVRHGSAAIASQEVDGCAASGEFPTFELNRELVVPEWIHWQTKTRGFWSKCDALSRGTSGKNRIQPELFLTVRVPLPSLAEQRQVVTRIEGFATQVRRACILRNYAAAEADALLAAATARVFESKEDWKEMAVGDFCEPPQYGYTESATEQAVGPRFLRITDIQNGRVDWKRVPFCRCPEPDKYLLRPNDLVFARTGATTGKSFVIRDCPEAVFASYLIRLRVRDTVSVDYLYRYFQSPSYWAQIADERTGTGQPNLNGSKLERIRVPVAPLCEQRKIVSYLTELGTRVNELKRLQAETTTELDALLPSVLDRAYKGELSAR